MLESCVHPWDPNNVYKDECRRFVSIGHKPFTFILLKGTEGRGGEGRGGGAGLHENKCYLKNEEDLVFSHNLENVMAEHNDLLPYLIINLKCSPISHHTQYKLSIRTNLPTNDTLFRYMRKVTTNHKHLCTMLTTKLWMSLHMVQAQQAIQKSLTCCVTESPK